MKRKNVVEPGLPAAAELDLRASWPTADDSERKGGSAPFYGDLMMVVIMNEEDEGSRVEARS